MHKVTFFPLGNADCCRIDLENGQKILFDFAAMRDPKDEYDLRIDLPEELRSDLEAGVLVGSFDHRNRVIYLADTIPSPPDSEEWPTLYIRGCKGLKNRVDEIMIRSDSQMQYIGEWHSHPDGYDIEPSDDDRQVFACLSEHMALDGNPALMLIAGEHNFRLMVDSIGCSISVDRTH